MGAVGAAAHERPLRQISPPVPSETATDHGESAASGSFDMRQMLEVLMRMMDANAQEITSNARKMNANAQNLQQEMNANARKMDANTQALRGDMRTQ